MKYVLVDFFLVNIQQIISASNVFSEMKELISTIIESHIVTSLIQSYCKIKYLHTGYIEDLVSTETIGTTLNIY